jgi:segregation and condensation protein A
LFKLLKTFTRLMNQFDEAQKKATVHRVIKYEYTIQEQQAYVMNVLNKQDRADFKAVFGKLRDRIHAIVTFLGLLELFNAGVVTIVQGEGINNFWMSKGEILQVEKISDTV